MWWILTSQDTYRTHNSLSVIATTDKATHVFMAWAYHKPARHPIYRTVRGRRIQCGYKYIWDTPTIANQTTWGKTLRHTFSLTALTPAATIWYYLFSPNGPYGLQIQGPLSHATLYSLRPWTQRLYVATNNQGMFYTDDFVTHRDYPIGVPHWEPLNLGLEPGAQFLGFRGDPFIPEGRQYFLDVRGVYRRTIGPWGNFLPRTTVIAAVGCNDVPESRFANNGLDVNINQPGWVAAIFVGQHTVNGAPQYRHYFCLSTDHALTWSITVAEDGTLNLPYFTCLTVGATKGASPYPAGRVIYFMARETTNAYCLRSIDGGATWEAFLIGTAINRTEYLAYEGQLLVDPASQDKCYFTGCLNPDPAYVLKRAADHGETWADYDAAADQPLGNDISYHALAITTTGILRTGPDIGRIFIHRTADGGASWSKTAPDLPSAHLCLTIVQGVPNSLYIPGQILDGWMNYHLIWASANEGATMIPKSGRYAHVPDTGGGNSIPYTAGGIRAVLPILT